MTQSEFDKNHPSLKGEGLFPPDDYCLKERDNCFHRDEIHKTQLDKEIVRRAIKEQMGLEDYSGQECLKELKQKLGLEEK